MLSNPQAPPKVPPRAFFQTRGTHINHTYNLLGGLSGFPVTISATTPSFIQIADDKPATPIRTARSILSLRANHIYDLLGGPPPAQYGPGRNYLETDPDNHIPWEVTDAVYERINHNARPVQKERKLYLDKHTRVLPPQSPAHHSDFPGQRPEGDPEQNTSRDPARDGFLRATKEHRDPIGQAMMLKFPPDPKGSVKTRTWSDTKPEEPKSLQPELDAMVMAHTLKISRYEDFHAEWNNLQARLTNLAGELRAEYARLVDTVGRLHHQLIRNRIKNYEYKPARSFLVQQMDDIFVTIGHVAHTLGTMFAVGRAVAQGVCPVGGFYRGKLDVAACNAVLYLRSVFPEFIKVNTRSTPIPADPMAPEPSMLAFTSEMPTYDFHDIMVSIWRRYPAKLQSIHQAVFRDGFDGIEELTQKDKANAMALLGYGGEWTP